MKPYGTCTDRKMLYPAIGELGCDRERNHTGYHYDRAERLYWFPGATRLEEIQFTGEEQQ